MPADYSFTFLLLLLSLSHNTCLLCNFHNFRTNVESEDFVAATNQVTFPASSSSSRQCTSFTIIDDNVAIEGPETFVAVLNLPPTVQPGQIIETVITILDDDGK